MRFRSPVQQQVTRRHAPQRLLGYRIQRQRLLLQQRERLGHLEVPPQQIRLQEPGVGQPGIDLQRPAERRLGLLDVVALQGQQGQRGMDLRRVGVGLQRGLKLAGRVALVVLLHEEHPRLVVRRPVVRVVLQRVGVQLVDQEIELLGLAVPPRRLGGGQADPAQRLRGRHVVVVVVMHQPGVAAARLVQLAGQTVQFGQQPAGLQLIVVDLDGLPDKFPRFIERPVLEGDRRQLGQDVGRLRFRIARARLRFRKSCQHLHRLVVLPVGGQAVGQPDGRRYVLAGGRPVKIGGLGVLSVQPEFSGGGQRILSPPRRQRGK